MVNKRSNLKAIILLIAAVFLIASCGNNDKNSGNAKNEARKYFERGESYYKLGKTDKAIKEFETALLYDKEHKLAHYNLAVLYREKGQNADAIHEFEQYLKFSTEDDAVVRKYVSEELERLKKK